MSSRYTGSAHRYRLARQAQQGQHYSAIEAAQSDPGFEIGEEVRVKSTGIVARVSGKTSWGDYELEGIKGSYPWRLIERTKNE